MTREEVEQRITDIVREHLRNKETTIKPKRRFAKLGLDSLDRVEIVMDIEEKFGLTIPDADCDGLDSIRDCTDCVARLLAASGKLEN